MTPSARLAAAIEVLDDQAARRRPVADSLKDWGVNHRFAGSGDRSAIASLVYDALRRRSSARWFMQAETGRATLIGMLALQRRLETDAIARLFSGERFAPEALTGDEQQALNTRHLGDAPGDVQADVPEWLWSAFSASLGPAAISEGIALATRAPLDIRANTLKSTQAALATELATLGVQPTPFAPHGLRIDVGPEGRSPALQAEEGFVKGWFEIQDEGSQLAGLLAGAKPGHQVLDLCAGGGGKTLELAAAMANKGQIFATDHDRRRLVPIHDRLARAGVRNVQVRTPRGPLPIDDLAGKMDLVLVDAPCSGTGTWRRNPDAKWRMRPNSLADRQADQTRVLREGAACVRPGGRLVYVTCSVLAAENDLAVTGFLATAGDFTPLAPEKIVAEAGLAAQLGGFRSVSGQGVQLTPARCQTDGFFISVMQRNA